MVLPKIEERTLYEPIISYLKELGFQAIGNTMVMKKEPDILFKYEALTFVIEVKIGKTEQIGLDAVAQAYDYGRKLNTQNVIILVYPEQLRREVISNYDIIPNIALNTRISVISLTEYWTESMETTLELFFTQMKERIEQGKTKIDFATTVKLIERYASDLNSVVYQIRTDELISEVVNKLDLFTSIGEIKDKDTAKKQVVNLASFLFFNQLLFYHIYKKKAKSNDLPEFDEIKQIKDIQSYFDKITKIDYQSIYKVNLLGHLPNKSNVIEVVNDIIKAIKLLRAEHITHDLAGRFFHDLIPFEVRKVLAAFYTHPNAADLLANLAIDKWDQTVIDPACGSGTLLVVSYKRKQELYENSYGYKNINEIHRKFIENDLTGIDIMPFAAHISAINLTMQNIEEKTNTIRIATQDSLELAESLKSSKFKKDGVLFSPYTSQIQKTLEEIEYAKVLRKRGSVSGEGRGSEFLLKPVDVVIMNPPFSDREKMPKEMRDKLNKNELSRICGNQVNLWGYFLALADRLLKPNGKIAAVIPINFARGLATEKIRRYILKNYKIEYLIKPVSDFAFSEGASFRDILLIASKGKSKKDDKIKLVFLNESIKSLYPEEIIRIADEIRQGISSEKITINTVTQNEISNSLGNMMPFLSQSSVELLKILNPVLNSEKLVNIDQGKFSEGFHASPKGLSQLLFITNSFTEDRAKRAFLILDKRDTYTITASIKNTEINFKIPISKLDRAIRTITGLRKLAINETDFFVKSPFDGFEKIIELSKWKKGSQINWQKIDQEANRKKSYIFIPERFNPYSANTHLLSYYSEEPVVIPHTLRFGNNFSKEDSKLQVLFVNSIVFLSQLVMNKEETTGQYIHIMDSDLRIMKYFNINKLLESDKERLLKLFDEISNIEFPNLIDQLKKRFEPRIKLDSLILNILGMDEFDIPEVLIRVYDIVLRELNYMKM